MNELEKYVQSLQDLGETDIKAKVEKWKIDNKWNQPEVKEKLAKTPVEEVVKTPVEEAKIDPVVETDASAPGKPKNAFEALSSGDGFFQYIEPNTGEEKVDFSLFSSETFDNLDLEILRKLQPNLKSIFEDDLKKTQALDNVVIDTFRPFGEKAIYNELGVLVFGDSANPVDQDGIQNILRSYGEKNNAKTLYDLNLSDDLSTQFDDPQKNELKYTPATTIRTTVSGGRKSGQSLYHDKTLFSQALRFIGNDPLGTDIDKIKNYNDSRSDSTLIGLNYGDVTIDVDGTPMTQSQLRDKIRKFDRENKDTTELRRKLDKHGGGNFYGIDVGTMQEMYIAENLPQYNEAAYAKEANVTFENGKNFLDPERLYFLSAESRLQSGNYDPEEKDFLEKQVAKGTEKYGEQLYNSKGNTPYEMKTIQTTTAAIKVASEITELDQLKRMLVDKKDRVVVLAQAALELLKQQQQSTATVDKKGSGLDVFKPLSIDGGLFYSQSDFNKGSVLNSANSKNEKLSKLAQRQILYLEEIVATGQIPESPGFNVVAEFGLGIGLPVFVKEEDTRLSVEESSHKLGYLSGDSEIVRAFNNAMDSYDISNKAIQINRNPLTRKTSIVKDFFEGGLELLLKDLGEDLIIDTEEKQIITDAFEQAGVQVRDSNGDYTPEFEEALAPSRTTKITQGAYGLTKILLQFTALRKVLGKPIGAGSSFAENFIINSTRTSRFGAIRNAGNFLNRTIQGTVIGAPGKLGLVGATLEEMTLFELANMSNDIVTGGKEEYLPGEGLKLGFAISTGGFAGRYGFKAISSKLSQNSVLADIIYNTTAATPLRQNISNTITRSLGGGFSMVNADLLLNPVSFIEDFEASKYFGHVLDEAAILFMAGKMNGALTTKKGRSLESVKNHVVEELRYMQGKDPIVIGEAAKALGVDPSVTKDKNGTEVILEAANKEANKVKQDLKDNKITEKEAIDKINTISKNSLNLTNQSKLNELKKLIATDPSLPSNGETYFAIQQFISGNKTSEKNSKIISQLGPEFLLDKMKLKNTPTNLRFARQIIFNEKYIQSLLDGGGVLFTPEGAKIIGEGKFRANTEEIRKQTYQFLKQRFALENKLLQLQEKSKKGLTETEKKELEEETNKIQEELNLYLEGGEKFEANQEALDRDFETELVKEKKKSQSIEITTSKGKSLGKYVNTALFKEILKSDGVEFDEKVLAYTTKSGDRVINEDAIRKVRKISDPFHERAHAYFLDIILKDSTGKVTEEGIKTIDSILKNLTPSERAILDAEVKNRYDTKKDKSEYYEEYIGVMGELMRDGKIKNRKNFTDGLRALIPLFNDRGFESLTDSGADLFKLIQNAAEGNTGAEKKLGELAEQKAKKTTSETASGKPSLAKDFKKDKESETVLQAIDNLIPRDVKTKKEYDKFIRDPRKNTKVFESLMNEGGAINNYIRSKSTSKEEAQKATENLQDRMLNFNPEALRADGKKVGVEGFGESIFANTRFAKLFAKSELFKESEKKKQEKRQDDNTLQLADKSTSSSKTKEVDTDVKLVDNIKVNKNPLSVDFKNKVREFVTKQLESVDVNSEKFRKQVFKPSKAFVDFIVKDLIGGPKKFREFLNENPTFYKALNITDLVAIDNGRVKKGQPRLFTELNRRLTKQSEIEKFMMQGRVPYLTTTQQKAGANLYNRLNPKVAAVINNFFGSTPQNNSNRKNTIAKIIAKKLIAEAAPSTELFKAKTSLDRAKTSEKLQVSQNAKFSRSGDPTKGIKEQIHQDKSKAKLLIDDGMSKAAAEKQVFKNLVAQTVDVLTREDGISAGFGNAMLTYIVTPFNLSSGGNSARRNYVAITDGSQTRSKDKAKTKKALEDNELFDLTKLRNQIKNSGVSELGPQFTIPQLKQMSLALRAASKASIARNQDDIVAITNGKKDFYGGLYRTYDANPEANLPGLKQIIYPFDQSSNATWGRKVATAANDANKGDKIPYLEHWLPYGQWAITTVATFGMPKASRDAWVKYANEHYYQENISLKTKTAVDKTYTVKLEDGTEVTWKSKDQNHPLLEAQLQKFRETGDPKYLDAASKFSDIRKYPGVHTEVNPFTHGKYGVMDAVKYGLKVSPELEANLEVQHEASSLINKIIIGEITKATAQKRMNAFKPLAPGMAKAAKRNNSLLPSAIEYDAPTTVKKVVEALGKTDAALRNGRKLKAPRKEIYTMDLDDTLIRSKSKIEVEMPDSRVFKINATEFAKRAGELENEGAKFDFIEFEKIIDGKKGPLFKVLENINAKKGLNDFFILTARPAAAAPAIKQFFDALGYDIPLKNITGLGDGKPQAKAGWIMGKAAEGYNDFYFADDAIGNVKAVKDVLSQLDVKSKVQQAKFSKAKTFDTIVNDMIKESAGIETYKEYSAARAKTVGASKGKYNFFIPASAEDFTGLLYKMLGKGKKGDAQMAFLKTNLLDTYDRAESAVTQAKIAAANDFKALKTNLKTLPTSLSKPTGIGGFTFSHAVRVAAWTAQGMEIPGLSKKDIKDLNDFVNKNAELKVFTNELLKIQKGKLYPKPGKEWLGGNITSDIINDINKVNRAEYQQEFRENVDIIFSEANMNKMEAAYGTRWREAMEDSLRRMKSGSNRPPGGNRATDGILDWLNNSVGAVMFLNTRSALLQTISAVNFINWGDNNIAKAGAAFANQPQYWKDFMQLMNSDYLVERRNGLKINVSESEIADAVRDSGNKPKAAIAYLLSKGFVMTRFADSFAIAAGGSTFYRNRVKSLLGKGMEQKAAEAQAFEDFRQIAEESQQSSNPNRISMQQASTAGRVILAWANTPMQYARIQKRAAQDLINGRGDWKTNVSKIAYYGAVQNLIFNSLQQAVFALGFGEDDDAEKQTAKEKEKIYRVANGMIDSQLKGLGIGGAAVVALKSALMELGKQHAKDRPKYEEAVFDLLGFSPPLGSKVQKISGGLRSFSWNMKDIKDKGFSLDNPAYLAGAQITTGLTNVPLDRVVKKINSMRGLVSEQSSLWQKVALGLGWSTWDVGLGYYGGFDAAKVLTPEEEKVKEIDDMKKLTKTKEQIDMLLNLGLTKKEIKDLGKEQARVEKIIELQNAEAKPKEEAKVKEEIKEETKPEPKAEPEVKAKPKTESAERRLRRQFDSIKGENKPEQVKTLLDYGLSKKQVRALRYEKDRVKKILELMYKNK